ncbi:hypothetical protein Rin_00014610 [Candidatus Regiella insecticola 5.15]|uniref:Uncharacterized protein n=1 Tax=Candidatus Regiella insecticola 5.15 TaxID=1005043 RepID=G2H081_9ENTR|nr:hypothetical protein [Candidatus Regiella insecticola]EGY28608.1 hypothetical protein Rin_00014610 [Candidatus Regiella insecticola 5.15]
MVDAVNYSIPVNHSMSANSSRSLQGVTNVKNTVDKPNQPPATTIQIVAGFLLGLSGIGGIVLWICCIGANANRAEINN